MPSLYEELREAIETRLRHFEQNISSLRGRLAGGRPGVGDALDLVSYYPGWIRDFHEAEMARAADDKNRIDLARALLLAIIQQADLVETWFSLERISSVPLSLYRAVERTCEQLGLGARRAVLAAGRPDNYETLVDDLQAEVFSGLGPGADLPHFPPRLQDLKLAMIQVPTFEGSEPLWRPIVLGHELGHLAAIERESVQEFDVPARIDFGAFSNIALPFDASWGATPELVLFRIAQSWVEELICDAHAIRRFGPAGAAALSEFLDVVGATGHVSFSHPPGWLRVRRLVDWVGDAGHGALAAVMEPWIELAGTALPPMENWATVLTSQLDQLGDEVMAVIADWPEEYDFKSRSEVVDAALKDIGGSVPVRQRYASADQVTDQDIINTGWCGRAARLEVPVSRLITKSLDDAEFVRQWIESGGEHAAEEGESAPGGSGCCRRSRSAGDCNPKTPIA